MKKQLIIIGITLVLIVVGFSGCTETTENNGTNNNDGNNGVELTKFVGNWTLSDYEGNRWDHFNRKLNFYEDETAFLTWEPEEGGVISLTSTYSVDGNKLVFGSESFSNPLFPIRNYYYSFQDDSTIVLTPEGKDYSGTYVKE